MRAHAYVDRIDLADLRPVERPDPDPGPSDVVIKIQAVALNFRDLAIARGHYHIGVQPPLIPLSDGAGVVVSVGNRVKRVRVGDLACPVYLPDWIDGPVSPQVARRRLGGPSDGVLAEYICLDEKEVVRAPSHLSAAEAATLPVAAVTAWHSLHQIGQVRPGENVVVQGSGGVSIAALQFAHAAGARVIMTTRRPDHEERLRQLLIGYVADTSAAIDIFEAIRHAVTIHIGSAGSRSSFEKLVRAMEHQKIKPAVGQVYPVSRLHEAFDRLGRGGVLGKTVIEL